MAMLKVCTAWLHIHIMAILKVCTYNLQPDYLNRFLCFFLGLYTLLITPDYKCIHKIHMNVQWSLPGGGGGGVEGCSAQDLDLTDLTTSEKRRGSKRSKTGLWQI